MKNYITLLAVTALTVTFVPSAMARNISKEDQIKQAVLAAPVALRADATVVTYNAKGDPVVLRQGTNDIVCTPNQAGSKRFSVSCYQKILRAQRDMQAKEKAEGKTPKAIRADIQAALASGKLSHPPMGTAMYSLSGKTEATAKGMWVVLTPGLTAEQTGLPTKPTPQGTPWLMRAGTPAAHIHIPQHGTENPM